eukprot:TRINITY_DN65986_c0_g2_i1.p1 TRINITY_DN65986_c0_g2~~TRINITY_DN65986_c0_g2_i1.p1  ORF type:complete len:191 (+),score=18.40 TRINITY_DN65986_c0_g2_i1:262-834(+)
MGVPRTGLPTQSATYNVVYNMETKVTSFGSAGKFCSGEYNPDHHNFEFLLALMKKYAQSSPLYSTVTCVILAEHSDKLQPDQEETALKHCRQQSATDAYWCHKGEQQDNPGMIEQAWHHQEHHPTHDCHFSWIRWNQRKRGECLCGELERSFGAASLAGFGLGHPDVKQLEALKADPSCRNCTAGFGEQW